MWTSDLHMHTHIHVHMNTYTHAKEKRKGSACYVKNGQQTVFSSTKEPCSVFKCSSAKGTITPHSLWLSQRAGTRCCVLRTTHVLQEHILGAGERNQWLGALAALQGTQVPFSVPTSVACIVTFNSRSRRSDALFWHPEVHAHLHTHKIK